VIIDATDSLKTKFMMNDVCVRHGKPFSVAGVKEWQGQAMTVVPGSACYRCVFDNVLASDKGRPSQFGVLGVLPGLLGIIQATEAIKCILGCGELLTNKLLVVDLFTMRFKPVQIDPDIDCFCRSV